MIPSCHGSNVGWCVDGGHALVTDISGGKTLYAGAPLPSENYRLACGDEFAAGNSVFRIDQSSVEAETGTVNIVVPKPARSKAIWSLERARGSNLWAFQSG